MRDTKIFWRITCHKLLPLSLKVSNSTLEMLVYRKVFHGYLEKLAETYPHFLIYQFVYSLLK